MEVEVVKSFKLRKKVDRSHNNTQSQTQTQTQTKVISFFDFCLSEKLKLFFFVFVGNDWIFSSPENANLANLKAFCSHP